MAAENVSAGAVSRASQPWQAIDWQAVSENVRQLQVRIVKATQAGRWGKVKALQRLLTHSFSGKALAVRRVTENDGKKTPGVDATVWNTPAKKMEAVHSLKQCGYQARPLRRVYIPKSNGQKRPLGIPTMKDRAMQALYLLALDPIAEVTADPNSYGFRKERSCADAIEQCFTALARSQAPRWVLEGDIKSCFDRISHTWLLANVPMDKTILRKWLSAGYLDKHAFFETEAGTPQGGILSPVLANLALDGLERVLHAHFPRSAREPRQAGSSSHPRKYKVGLIRYADDFVITGRSRELLETEVKPVVEQFLRERGLELSPEKTQITHLEEGFDFLAQNVRIYQGKLLIKPAKASIKRFLNEIRAVIKANKADTPYGLIGKLNPKIRGWANYHRHVVSKDIFYQVDRAIHRSLWQWAKRRHSNKTRQWIVQRYFTTVGEDHWRFFGQMRTAEGSLRRLWLTKAAATPIRRHIKIQGAANPYAPEWEVYFEERLGVHMVGNLRGKRVLRYLWREQHGICPVCQQPITKLTGWHNHHIVHRVRGGSDTFENRMLLHPECHRQVHSQKRSVGKPRPLVGVRKA